MSHEDRKKDKANIILILNHGIGELLMSIPLVKKISDIDNEYNVTILIGSQSERQILEMAGISNNINIMIIHRHNIIQQIMNIKRLKPKYLLAPHAIGGIWISIIALIINAEKAIGYSGVISKIGFNCHIPFPVNKHKVEYYAEFIQPIIGNCEGLKKRDVQLKISNAELEDAYKSYPSRKNGGKWIVMAPGSGEIEKHKRWPATNYGSLANMLLKYDPQIRLLIIGGAAERTLLDEIQCSIAPLDQRYLTATPSQLKHSMALMHGAKCIISGCSGSAHMAAAMCVPIVGLFGPTNPGFTGPYSDQLYAIRTGMKCSPCYRRSFIKGCGDPLCMRNIAVENVFNAVKDVLDNKTYPNIPWIKSTNAKNAII